MDITDVYEKIYTNFKNAKVFQELLLEAFENTINPNIYQYSFLTNVEFSNLLSLVKSYEGGNFFEIGCGFGGVTSKLENLVKGNFFAIDFSKCAIKSAKEYNSNVKFTVNDMDNYIIPAGYFDVIYSIDAVQNSSKKEILFKNIHNGLKQNGKIAITTWIDMKYFTKLKKHPYIRLIEKSGLNIVNFIEPDPGLIKQKKFYRLIYENRISIENELGHAAFKLIINEGLYLFKNSSVSRFHLLLNKYGSGASL